MKRITALIALLPCLLLLSAPAFAQPASSIIQEDASAEAVFTTALQAFEQGDYEVAARLFGVSANTYDLHLKTTAALVMQGKALYRAEAYQEAERILSTFIRNYPTSRYVSSARETLEYIQSALSAIDDDTITLRIGVLLPLDDASALLAQELFNGIHLAVEDFNSQPRFDLTGMPNIQAQMVFGDTENDADLAGEAVRQLVASGVDVIIGPLFSDEALAAANEAERNGVVLMAPLATSESVSAGKYHVFQANPSVRLRGKLMAQFAIRSLGMKSLGLIYDRNSSESMAMARGFEDEVFNDPEAELRYKYVIRDTRNWFRLSQHVIPDTLSKANGVYIPMSGNNASQIIGGALGSFDRMDAKVRILGNVEWHNLPLGTQASHYGTTYSNDYFHADTDSTAIFFLETYKDRFGLDPGRLAFTGYDVTQYLLKNLVSQRQTGGQLVNIIRTSGEYRGLGTKLDFLNGNINEALFYHRYRNSIPELLR